MAGTSKTPFSVIYNRFLEKITDDMYVELTPQDTLKDLRNLLVDAIPGFEFPRHNLYDYEISTEVINENAVAEGDFVIGVIWYNLTDAQIVDPNESAEAGEMGEDMVPAVYVERSNFNCELTSEEINILALLMKQAWIQRQVASIENTRMKYSGSDFKMTSQANHLSKLLNLLSEAQRESFHMQRLYKRRKTDKNFNGRYMSTWRRFRESTATGGSTGFVEQI